MRLSSSGARKAQCAAQAWDHTPGTRAPAAGTGRFGTTFFVTRPCGVSLVSDPVGDGSERGPPRLERGARGEAVERVELGEGVAAVVVDERLGRSPNVACTLPAAPGRREEPDLFLGSLPPELGDFTGGGGNGNVTSERSRGLGAGCVAPGAGEAAGAAGAPESAAAAAGLVLEIFGILKLDMTENTLQIKNAIKFGTCRRKKHGSKRDHPRLGNAITIGNKSDRTWNTRIF